MSTQKTLLPGQPGSKKWLEKYGYRLVCVRYKYDMQRKTKLKTVELIVEELPWDKNAERIPGNKLVQIRINYGEIQEGRLVRAAGGRWNRASKLWELPYKEAVALGLTERMIKA